MPRLYIVGDSFTAAEKQGRDQEKTWWFRLAQKLGCWGFMNWSAIGSSQEYSWYMLQIQLAEIQPDDYLLIVATHPARRWWVTDDPTLGKVEFLNDADHIDPNIAKTAAMWERYVQRPQLDSIATLQRLGWLSAIAQQRGWRPPLVIFGFDQMIPGYDEFKNIKFSKGSLTENIATTEVPGGHTNNAYNSLIQGVDPRYNHLCLRNHEVLLNKVYETFVNDAELDLTTGFNLGILTDQSLQDPAFIEKELDPVKVEQRKSTIKTRNILSMFQMSKFG